MATLSRFAIGQTSVRAGCSSSTVRAGAQQSDKAAGQLEWLGWAFVPELRYDRLAVQAQDLAGNLSSAPPGRVKLRYIGLRPPRADSDSRARVPYLVLDTDARDVPLASAARVERRERRAAGGDPASGAGRPGRYVLVASAGRRIALGHARRAEP